jgi:NodT family efflux transporter outer membrane factor (OMF) lipoprotein
MGRKGAWAVIALTGVVSLAGCAVGPDFKRPQAPEAPGYTPEPLTEVTASAPVTGGAPQRFVQDLDIPGQWWTLFHCESLNRLIERALQNNPDIDAARAALRQANESLYARQGAMFPVATAAVAGERQRLAGAIIGQPQFTPTFSVVTASLNISYAPDVFGGTRRQIESLAARAESRGFELEATYLTLTSNLVVAAVQEASLRGQIAATEQILKIESDELDLIRQRFKVGVVSQAEVLLQEATLEQTRATLPALRRQLAQLRNELTALAGQIPSQEVSETFALGSLTLPQEMPVSLPSKLVEQRPDVRSAEAQLHAASAGVGVAIANQLPQFSITAGAGATARGFGSFPGTGVWNIAGNVGQTLFDAGTLKHTKRAAVAALDQATAQYRATMIKAFQSVADVLRALQSDADALAAQNAAERSAYASLELARWQFSAETTDHLTVLTAERTWQQARINLVQAESNRYADTAALFQALGGGWWHRDDANASRTREVPLRR